jgi:UDP-N-acetylmuramate--alanine ligase
MTLVNARDQRLQSIRATCRFGDHGDVQFAGAYDCAGDHASVTLDGIQYSIPFPGNHSASNLLAALGVCRMLDCDPGSLQTGAATFGGVERRFDRIPTRRGVLVIDDFAHNPDKIRAAMTTARDLGTRLFALFQPHGFGPARFMRNEFARVFAETLRPGDALFLLPIYYAGGTANKDISSRDMAADIKGSDARVLSPPSREEAIACIARDVQPGDVVMSMGARDPSLADFARALAHAIDTSSD